VGGRLATEGSLALVARAFDDPSVRRIWAQTMTVNHASRRVMEHGGLEFVRTFFEEWDDEIPGGEHGEVEYELRHADWLNRGGSSTL
jgi:RimJ/RimL family protein N-acetyltransferase